VELGLGLENCTLFVVKGLQGLVGALAQLELEPDYILQELSIHGKHPAQIEPIRHPFLAPTKKVIGQPHPIIKTPTIPKLDKLRMGLIDIPDSLANMKLAALCEPKLLGKRDQPFAGGGLQQLVVGAAWGQLGD
jgi:hypothetical protein